MSTEADGRADLQVAEDGDTGLRIDGCGVHGCGGGGATAADAQQLNFSHDETIPTSMFAHNTMQVCEALKVEDLLWGRFAPHARIPLVVALDEANDPAATVTKNSLFVVGGVVGDKFGLIAGASEGLAGFHKHVCATLGDFEGGVDFGCVVGGADVVKSGLSFWLKGHARGLREVGSRKGDFEEAQDRWKRGDGCDVEVSPATQVADIPPEVCVDAAGSAGDTAD